MPLDMILQDCRRSRGSCRQKELRRDRGQCRVEQRLFEDARMTDVRWNGSSIRLCHVLTKQESLCKVSYGVSKEYWRLRRVSIICWRPASSAAPAKVCT